MLNQELAAVEAPAPTMSQEEVERLRELLNANDQQQQASTKEALKQKQQDLKERVLLAAKFQDQLNGVVYEECKPIVESWRVIEDLVHKLGRMRQQVLVKEQLSRTGFNVPEAARTDELMIKTLTARLEACEQFYVEYKQREELFEEHLSGHAKNASDALRDIESSISSVNHQINNAEKKRTKNMETLVEAGLTPEDAHAQAKPTLADCIKQRNELTRLMEQREEQAAIIRSHVKQAALAFPEIDED